MEQGVSKNEKERVYEMRGFEERSEKSEVLIERIEIRHDRRFRSSMRSEQDQINIGSEMQ